MSRHKRQRRAQSFDSNLRAAFTQQAVGRILSTAVSFASVIVTSRYLGPVEYGALTTALAFVGLFAAFSDFGVNAVVARRAANDRSSLSTLIHQSVGLSLAYALPLALIIIATSYLVFGISNPTMAGYVSLLSPFVVLYSIASAYTPAFQVANDFRTPSLAEVVSASLTLGGAAVTAACHGAVWWFIVTTNIAAAVRLGVILLGARRASGLGVRWSACVWKDIVRESLPIGVTSVIGVIYYRADTVILSLMSDLGEVGKYNLAYRVIGVLSAIPSFLVSGSFYHLASCARNPEELSKRSSRLIRTVLLLSGPLAIGGALVSDEIVTVVGGTAYQSADRVLAVLFFASMLFAMNTVLGSVLTAVGREKVTLIVSAISLFLNIVLVITLAPGLGGFGAGMAFLGTEVAAFMGILFVYGRNIRIKGHLRAISDVLIALLVLSLAVVFARPMGLLWTILAGGSAYILVISLLRFISQGSRRSKREEMSRKELVDLDGR